MCSAVKLEAALGLIIAVLAIISFSYDNFGTTKVIAEIWKHEENPIVNKLNTDRL